MSEDTISFGAQLVKDNLLFIEKLISQFFYCFRSDDDCKLVIVSEESDFFGLKERFAQTVVDNQYAWKPAAIEWIAAQDAAEKQLKFNYALTGKALETCQWTDLFSLYQKVDKSDAKGTYEYEEVTHEYDLNVIKKVRREQKNNYIGSTNLNKMHKYLDYVTWLNHTGKSDSSLLESGCGAGATYHLIKAHCLKNSLNMPEYAGFDYGRTQVKRAIQNYPGESFFIGDCQNMAQIETNSFDCVIAHSVLQFVPDPFKALTEIIRVSKGDCFFSISCTTFENNYVQGPVEVEFSWRFLNRKIPTNLYFADFSKVTKELQANGLRFVLSDEAFNENLKYYSIKVYPRQWYDERYQNLDRSVDNYTLIE